MKNLLILFAIILIASCKTQHYIASDLDDIILVGSRAVNDRLDSVYIGAAANDGTGDPLRTAFIKTNAAINTLDSLFTEGLRYGYFKGSTSGKTQVRASAVAGSTVATLPASTGVLARLNDVNDSLNVIRAAATVGVALADSGTYNGGYITPRGLDVYTGHEEFVMGVNAAGGAIKAAPVAGAIPDASEGIADGYVICSMINIRYKQTLTGVKFLVGAAQGDYTADNNNKVGLYSSSGGTATLVASSATDGDLFKGAIGALVTKAFSSTYAAEAGIYYVAVIYNSSAQTTEPTIYSSDAVTNHADNLLVNNKFSFRVTGQTDLPATITIADATALTGTRCLYVY